MSGGHDDAYGTTDPYDENEHYSGHSDENQHYADEDRHYTEENRHYAEEDAYSTGESEHSIEENQHNSDVSERDAEERTFAAMPPAQGRGFAVTWWGQAWLKALEDTALDNAQLKAGRRMARSGAIGAVSVRPGRITAMVSDRDGTGHRSDVLLQRLSDDEWDRFLGMAVERAGHIAALLDREMPPHLVEDAAAAGVDLLPGIGDLEPQCTCDAWDHCGHTTALCYQVARLLDQDPFVLLLMRGRGERALLDELQVRSVAQAAQDEQGGTDPAQEEAPQDGVPADEAYAMGGILPPLPALPVLPEAPGVPPSLDTETPPAPGVDASAVEFLAARAAAGAHRLLAEALAPGHQDSVPEPELTVGQDAVRLAADHGSEPEIRVLDRLAEGTGRDREALRLAVRAWELGGAAALSVLEEEWTPQAESAARARAALASAWDDEERPALRATRNRWTVTGGRDSTGFGPGSGSGFGVQLRLGRDGRWWPYRKERGRWAPAGPAAQDPAAALAAADERE